MTAKRKSKNTRLRGTRTHGWGSHKKHRNSGHRGGTGNAGTGKRADCKKPSIWKDKDYFGKHGFKYHGKNAEKIGINVCSLEQNIPRLVKEKLVDKKGEAYVIDLKKIGFNKLLGSGKINEKLIITVQFASKQVINKVKKAGGEVILSKKNSDTSKNAEM